MKREALVLPGEILRHTFRFYSEKHPEGILTAVILQTDDGYFRLREWDDVSGWGDRSYYTFEEAKYWATH